MKFKVLKMLAVVVLFILPAVSFGQMITLGTAVNFVLFTTNGAMTNSGTPYLTHLTGNVGSNLAGSVTGFGNVDGQMHAANAVTLQATADVNSAYTQLDLVTPTAVHPVLLGGGETLLPGVYHMLNNTTLNTILTLDAGGNPNAVFIFQIDGTFSTLTGSKVRLVNGALACNVFWKTEGVISVAPGTTLRGSFIAHNAAINMSAPDTLEGRMLSINGAVAVSQLMAYKPIGCGSTVLTGPAAPALGAAAQFGVFSSIGGVTSTPITYVTGDVGSNSTTTTGFNPANVTGMIHPNPDAATAAAAGSLTLAYNYLVALPVDIELTDPANFGHDLVLTPHTYHTSPATMLTGNVILNAQGNPNAVFVIQINGAFSTSPLAKVILINGTQAKNVYWKIDGAVHILPNSVFIGTMVVAGAITLDAGDTLRGRALSIGGAVAINGSYISIAPAGCAAAPITGSNNVCSGSTTTLSDADAGGTWTSSNTTIATIGSSTGIVTGTVPGITTITYTSLLACTSSYSLTVTAGPSPITGPGAVCVGSTILLSSATPGGSWSSSNTALATVGALSRIVTGVAQGIPTISYTVAGGCVATKTLTVNTPSNAGTITGPSGVCVGSTITLSDAVAGGIWSSTNTNATVSPVGVVTGVASGLTTIRYRVTSACGADTATKIITVSTTSDPGTITGPSSVCTGTTIALSDAITGGTWSAANTTATVSNTGMVTGVAAGINTITYTVNNGCGLASTTKTVTVNASPNPGTITGPSSVCAGSSIILSDNVLGGLWTSSNANATVAAGVVTGVTAGSSTISYTVTNVTCTASATKTITVTPSAGAGTISGPAAVCDGFSIALTDAVAGGIWSSSNTTAATVSPAGVVTGAAAGLTTISYTVTSGCGTAVATKTVTVNPLPDAGTITGPSDVCTGTSITLSNNAAGGVWTSSNTSNATVSGSGVVFGSTPGSTIIRYEVTNACGTIIASKFITVNPGASAGTISGPASVCEGTSINLTDATSGGTWSSSNTNTTVSGVGTVTGNEPGSSVISYTVVNGCGTAVATKTITVNPLPNAGVITGSSTVCVGATITLTDNAAGGIWSNTNTNATVAAGLVTGHTAGLDTVMYTVANACGADTATKIISIILPPNAGTITGASSVCVGSVITLTNGVSGGTWSSSNALATVTAGSVTGVTAGNGIISYSVTNGCGTDIATKAITINPAPAVPVIATQPGATACIGTMYQNYGAATLPPTGTNYNWGVTNSTLWAQGTMHQYALVTFNAAGMAVVSLNATITGTGCTSKSDAMVSVGPSISETPVVSYFSNDHFVCTPNTENSYQWGYDDASTLDSTILTGEINQDYVNTAPDFTGKRYWVMTTAGGCMQKTYYRIPTAIQLADNSAHVSVYPNPASDMLNVVVTGAANEKMLIEVLNLVGQKVATVLAADNRAAVNISTLPAGTYIVAVYSKGAKIAAAKFTKN